MSLQNTLSPTHSYISSASGWSTLSMSAQLAISRGLRIDTTPKPLRESLFCPNAASVSYLLTCHPNWYSEFFYIRLQKILSINENTGIDVRSVACGLDHPLLNQPSAPSFQELSDFFLSEGVKLAVWAARKAMGEWGGDASEITHMVATTCTHAGNPGYDFHLARALGLRPDVERTLLHGAGCAGGLAALRTAATVALGAAALRVPARVLVVSCELPSLMARAELDAITRDQELRVGVTLFGDAASAVVLSNGVGDTWGERPVYELLAWEHRTLPETEKDIAFDMQPTGETYFGVLILVEFSRQISSSL